MKLTVHLRNLIIKDIINETFKNRREYLKNEISFIMYKIYESNFTSDELYVMKNYKHLFSKTSTMYLYSDGSYHGYHSLNNTISIPGSCKGLELNKADDSVKTRYSDYLDCTHKLDNDTRELSDKIRGLVYSVNTTNQLFSIWPDLLDEYPNLTKYFSKSNLSNMPAVIDVDLIKTAIAENK